MDPNLAGVISELLVNLSAGWFAAALIVPLQAKKPKSIGFRLLTTNVGLGILALIIAFTIRKL